MMFLGFLVVLLIAAVGCRVYFVAEDIAHIQVSHASTKNATIVVTLNFLWAMDQRWQPVLYCPGNRISVQQLQKVARQLEQMMLDYPRASQTVVEDLTRWVELGPVAKSPIFLPTRIFLQTEELVVDWVELERSYLHPAWHQDHVTVCAREGWKRRKLKHIPWSQPVAQDLYSGPEA